MARSRFRPGVYELVIASGITTSDLSIDNRMISLVGPKTATVYVNTQMSFTTGKLTVTWIADNLDGISGQMTA